MLLKDKKMRFKALLEKGEMVFAPCVWDCYSAKAAEMSGFKAALFHFTGIGQKETGKESLNESM